MYFSTLVFLFKIFMGNSYLDGLSLGVTLNDGLSK